LYHVRCYGVVFSGRKQFLATNLQVVVVWYVFLTRSCRIASSECGKRTRELLFFRGAPDPDLSQNSCSYKSPFKLFSIAPRCVYEQSQIWIWRFSGLCESMQKIATSLCPLLDPNLRLQNSQLHTTAAL
jgi:hypothetical protein